MSIRLLCCTGSLEGGGSERQLWQLTTRIDSTLFEPQIYLLNRRGTYLSQLPAQIPVHAFSTDDQPPRRGLPGTIHRRQIAHLRAVIQREKIEVLYDRTFHMTLVTAAACRATGCARVSTIVSPPSRDFARSDERFKWFKRKLLARAYRDRSSIAVAVSSAVADDTANFYGVPRELLRVVPSPVDIDTIQQQALEGAELAEDAGVDLRIALVGRLSTEKGQRTALAALAEVRKRHPAARIELELIGDGPDRSALLHATHELCLDHCVKFHGFQRNPYPWMKGAGLVCIPSEYEGLPNVALEAMALGTPLLTTNCSPALQELIGCDESRGGLTPVNDIASLADRLSDRLLHADVWKAKAQRAQAWVVEHHSLEPWMEQMQSLLRESLQLCGRGPRQ